MASPEVMLGVQTTGPLLASLLFQQAASEGDQEGFLVGEWRRRRTEEISDTHLQATRESVTLDIHALLPNAKIHQFYNNFGEISKSLLQQILGPNVKNVVGWYRFRRNTCLEALLLERAIHQKLTSLLSSQQASFVFAIFTSSTSANSSVHSFDHTFLRLVNGQFENIPFSIFNLGNTSHLEYKTHSQPTVSKYLKQLRVVQSANIAVDSPASIGTIQAIHQVLQGNLQGMHRQVLETEASIQQYLIDIASMEEKLQEQKHSEACKEMGTAKDEAGEKKAEPIKTEGMPALPQECFIEGSEKPTWSPNQTSGVDQKKPPPMS